MYLKVEIDGKEQFFAFDGKNSVSIGRAPESDIQLLAEGISRNHLLVTDEGGEYFATDLGSSQGTFLNEEKLEPKVRVSFNSFFPMKLGPSVHLYLVDEISAQAMRNEILRKQERAEAKKREMLKEQRNGKPKSQQSMADRVYVPKNKSGTNNTGTAKIVRRKKVAVRSPSAPVRKKSSGNGLFFAVALLIAGGAYLYTGWRKEFQKVGADSAAVNVAGSQAVEAGSKAVASGSSALKETGLSPKDAAGIIFLDKCLGDYEARLCAPLSEVRERAYYEGFVKLADSLYLVIDIEKLSNHYSNIEFDEDEKELALGKLARFLGRQFIRQDVLDNNLRVQAVHYQEELAGKAAVLTDILSLGLARMILENESVEDFTVIFYEGPDNDYAGHSELGKETLAKAFDNETLPFDLKVFWRTGLGDPLVGFFHSVPELELKGFEKLDDL